MVTVKGSKTDMCGLAPLQVRELLWLVHRKCMVKTLIGCKYCVSYLNEKNLEMCLASSAVLQLSQILRSCVNAFLSF